MSDIFSLGVTIMEIVTGHRDYPYEINEASAEKYINRVRFVFQMETLYEPSGTLHYIHTFNNLCAIFTGAWEMEKHI